MEVLRKLCIATFVSLLFLANCKEAASLEIRGIGDPCTDNATCSASVTGAVCIAGVCKCESDIISEDKSRCLVRIGGPCQEDDQCAGDEGTSGCLPGSGRCECKPGYTHSADLKQCLTVINDLNGQLCDEDNQCRFGTPGNFSSCRTVADETKKCLCNDNAVDGPSEPSNPIPNNNKCYLLAEKVGDPCVVQTQCTVKLEYSQCNNNACECANNYIPSPDSSKCLQKMNLGETCEYSEQCQHIDHSTCSKINPSTIGLCQCNVEYTSPPGRNDICLVKAIRIGDSCSDQAQCNTVTDSVCTEGKCICPQSYVNNQEGNGCLLKAAGLNSQCSQDVQCQDVANSLCQPSNNPNIKTCTCITNRFVESEKNTGFCVEIVHERNKPCNEEVQCTAGLGSLSTCADGVCQCKFNYGYHNGKCYIPAMLNETCLVVEQCYVGINNLTMCSFSPEDTQQRRCRCLPGTIPFQNNQKCFDQNKRVGSTCNSHDECTVSIFGTVYCDTFTKSCACQLGSYPTASNTVCTSGSGASNIQQYFLFIVTLLLVICS